MFHKHVSPNKADASVIDGVLVVSLPNAETPSVWRFDLAQVSIGGVEVRESNGHFILGARNAKGELNDIASYPNKEGATQALTAITEAMLNAPATRPATVHVAANNDASAVMQPTTAPVVAAVPKRSFVGRWARRIGTLAAIIVLLGLAILIYAMSTYVQRGGTFSSNDTARNETRAIESTHTDALGKIDPGVPMSADELLGGG